MPKYVESTNVPPRARDLLLLAAGASVLRVFIRSGQSGRAYDLIVRKGNLAFGSALWTTPLAVLGLLAALALALGALPRVRLYPRRALALGLVASALAAALAAVAPTFGAYEASRTLGLVGTGVAGASLVALAVERLPRPWLLFLPATGLAARDLARWVGPSFRSAYAHSQAYLVLSAALLVALAVASRVLLGDEATEEVEPASTSPDPYIATRLLALATLGGAAGVLVCAPELRIARLDLFGLGRQGTELALRIAADAFPLLLIAALLARCAGLGLSLRILAALAAALLVLAWSLPGARYPATLLGPTLGGLLAGLAALRLALGVPPERRLAAALAVSAATLGTEAALTPLWASRLAPNAVTPLLFAVAAALLVLIALPVRRPNPVPT